MGQKWDGANSASVLCLFFAVGVISVRFLPGLWSTELSLLGGVLCLGFAAVFNPLRWLAAAGLGLSLATWVAGNVLAATLPPEYEQQSLTVEGTISGMVKPAANGSRFDMEVGAVSSGNQQLSGPRRVRLNIYSREISPRSGERWRFTVRLKRPHGLQNPGAGLNYETWLFHQRIGATGYVVNGQWWQLAQRSSVSLDLLRSVNSLRQRFSSYLAEELGQSINSGLLAALTVGVRSTLQDHVWRVLQDTGTIHLVAISGLHIGLVAWLAGSLGAWGWRRSATLCQIYPAMVAGAISGFLAGLIYALLAGFTLPTRRALVMLLVLVLAILLRRHTRPLTLLSLVLAAVLMIDPLAPLSSSLWLSFGAVAILVLVATGDHAGRSQRPTLLFRLTSVIGKWWRVQLWLLIGMLPVLLIAFQKISLIAPVANLVAVPIIGLVVVPMALAALLLWSLGFSTLAGYSVQLCNGLLEIVWQYLSFLGSISWASWTQAAPQFWVSSLAVTGLMLLILGRALPARWVGALWVLPMFMPAAIAPRPGEFKYTMLDVGQGLASVIQTANHVLIYDTGASFPGGFNLARVALIPYLRQIGVQKIDLMVISHGDNDHIGGATVLGQGMQINAVISSVKDRLVGATTCEAGQHWRWDKVEFEVLWPDRNNYNRGNNSSCVIKVSSDNGSVLLTGDIERDAEEALVDASRNQLNSDVLQVPHHGSKTSSSALLLNAVSPQLAVVSAGYLNRFHHPHKGVVDSYRRRDIALLNTAKEGAVEIGFGHDGLTVLTQRTRSTRFWQAPGHTDLVSLNSRLRRSSAAVLQSPPVKLPMTIQ